MQYVAFLKSDFNRRAWVSIRNRSTEKETLMANMGLPCEHYDSDSEVKLCASESKLILINAQKQEQYLEY